MDRTQKTLAMAEVAGWGSALVAFKSRAEPRREHPIQIGTLRYTLPSS